jgi:hypothetical protein
MILLCLKSFPKLPSEEVYIGCMEMGFIGFFTKLNLFIAINKNHHWLCPMSFLYIFSLPVVQYFLLLWIINFHIKTKRSQVMGSEVSVCDMELELTVAN